MDTEIAVEFGEGGNGTEMATTGWSNAERHFCWMIGLESVAVLPRPSSAARYQLSLDVRPHVRPPRLPKQALIIAVNDMIVSVSEITHDVSITCEVPRLAIDLADKLVVRLLHPNAKSPRAISDIDDERILSIAVERMVLRWFGALANASSRVGDAASVSDSTTEASDASPQLQSAASAVGAAETHRSRLTAPPPGRLRSREEVAGRVTAAP